VIISEPDLRIFKSSSRERGAPLSESLFVLVLVSVLVL
jgi:hypothetical protein